MKIKRTEKINQKTYSIFLCAALFWAVVFGIIGGIGVMMRRDKR